MKTNKTSKKGNKTENTFTEAKDKKNQLKFQKIKKQKKEAVIKETTKKKKEEEKGAITEEK